MTTAEVLAAIAWPDGEEPVVSDASGTPCLDVPSDQWRACVEALADGGFSYLDWLTAVDRFDRDDNPGLDVVVHLVAFGAGDQPGLRARVLVRTRVAAEELKLASLTPVFAGAAWHERESFEMFGVEFEGFADLSEFGLRPLLLPDGFEGTPLRKSFVLASRAAKPWPGAKEPGEGHDGAPARRKATAIGVPDESWGPRDWTPPGQEPTPPVTDNANPDAVGAGG